MNTSERRKNYTPEQLEAERAYTLRYRAENKERLAARAKARRAAGKCKSTSDYRKGFTPEQREAELAYKRQHYQETRDHQLAYAAQYREENIERLRASWVGLYRRRKDYFDKYREENKDRIASYRASWTAANRDRIAAKNAEWSQNNLDRHRVYQQRRRARKAQNGGALSTNIIETLLTKQRGLCACCRQRLNGSYELDHIVPLARGGQNSDDNVQLLTPRCNRQKGARNPIEFMQQARGTLL